MIEGKLVGAEKLREKFADAPDRVRAGLTRAITRLTAILLRDVKENRLTGQVLKVRTGRLRRSINMLVEGQNTDKVTGKVGTNLVYARPHEMGFKGTVNVREHLRQCTQAFGKPINPIQVTVKAHKMNMNFPERSFLRSALADLGPKIDEEIRKEANYIAKG